MSSTLLPPTTNAPPLANYPHARTVLTTPTTKTIYVSGTSSRNPDGTHAGYTENADGTITKDCRAQTAAVLRNIDSILRGATDGKSGLEAVVDATVFLTDIKRDYAAMNEAWNAVWVDKKRAPARTCVQVAGLPSERLVVEVKCVAVVAVE